MPEGDTIYRAAAKLRPALQGQVVRRFEAARVPRPHPRVGETIDAVDAKGKHLLIAFSGGYTLQTHMGMTGVWQLYADGQRWRRAPHLARCVIAVDGCQAVCFQAPTVRLVPTTSDGIEPAAHLGPDLCRPDADLQLALDRMGVIPEPGTTIDEVLLDQRVMAGVGNVYKSEVLWACRVHPFTPMDAIDRRTRQQLIETASRMLRANLARGPRTTVAGHPGTVAVYGHVREPCRRCGMPIRSARLGSLDRITYWCPRCQPPNADTTT